MEKRSAMRLIDDVDPDIRHFVDTINRGYAAHPPMEELSLPLRRIVAEQVRAPWRQGGPEMAQSEDLEAAGVRLRIHRPTADLGLPALFYLHGGGWTVFSIDTHDRLMREYAARAGVTVIGIDYSLSPEAKYPVALDEITGVIEWARDHAPALRIDADRMAIGGDSAGANLSVATCLWLRDTAQRPLQAMLLSYGAFAPERTPSHDLYGEPDDCLTASEMEEFWANYVVSPEQLADPYVAPLKADLHDLPPAFLAIAERDILLDGNRAFAEKLARAGVPTEAVLYEGATHSFLEAMSIARLAQAALDDQSRWLRARLMKI